MFLRVGQRAPKRNAMYIMAGAMKTVMIKVAVMTTSALLTMEPFRGEEALAVAGMLPLKRTSLVWAVNVLVWTGLPSRMMTPCAVE